MTVLLELDLHRTVHCLVQQLPTICKSNSSSQNHPKLFFPSYIATAFTKVLFDTPWMGL